MRALQVEPLPAGEEFIEPGFIPVVINRDLRAIQEIIVPSGASREQFNYLGFVYLRLIHAADFLKYTLEFDSRFTYDLDDQHFLELTAASRAPINIDLERTFEQVLVQTARVGGNQGLFAPFTGHDDSLNELRAAFTATESNLDRLAAAILGLTFQMEKTRSAS